MINNTIGRKFKTLLRRRNITYDKFSKIVGLRNKQHIYYMLNKADKDWKYFEIEHWCKILGVEVEKICSQK